MPVNNDVNDPTNTTVSIPTRNEDVQKKEVLATDGGSCAHSNGSTSEDEEDFDYEDVSTRKVSQVATDVLHPGGPPSNIHMENSSDIQIGSRLHYNAPVTINQYVHVLGSSEGSHDGILQEAVRAPIHGLNAKENNISQATLIGSNEKPRGISSLNGESHHHNAAATNYSKVASLCLHWRIFLATLAVIVLLLIILTALIVHFSSRSRDDLPKNTFYPAPKDPEPNPNTTLPGGHLIYSKEDWHGAEPKYERQLQHPTPFIVISHTGTPACYSSVVCAAQMRNFQDSHMGRDFPDVGYNFVAGGDGNVYEGRGWDATNMHTGFVTRCNIGISFIGNFVHDTPTNGQIEAVQELIKLGVRLGKIDKSYKLVAMNETFTTLSPGVVVYNIIAKWRHFWKPSYDDIGKCPYVV